MKPLEKQYLEKLKTIEELKIDILQQIAKASDKGLRSDEIVGAIESAKHLAQKLLDNNTKTDTEIQKIVGYR